MAKFCGFPPFSECMNFNLNFFHFAVPANQGGSPPSSQRQPQKMDVKPVETGSKPGAPAATPTAPGMAPPSASAPTSAASPTPPTTKSS